MHRCDNFLHMHNIVYNNRSLIFLQRSGDWLIIYVPSCMSVSPPTFRGVTWEEVCVCACKSVCSPNILNDLSGCSRAISGLASQPETCRPSLFTLHMHPDKQSNRLPLGSHRAQAPHQALGSVITEKFAFPPPPISPLLSFLLLLLPSPSIRLPAALETC